MSFGVRISRQTRVIGGLSAVLIPATVAGLMAMKGGIGVSATPGGWIDTIEARLLATSGEVVKIALSGEAADPLLGVYYAPLATFWQLSDPAPGASVLRSGLVLREEEAFGARLRVTWDDGTELAYRWPQPLPAIMGTGTGERHMLARLYDVVLSDPLQVPLAGFPSGSRFGADGIVHVPGEDGPPALWQDTGNTLTVTLTTGMVFELRVEDVVAAIDATPLVEATQ